jgi:hypothetical protein
MAFGPSDFADDTDFERHTLTLLGTHRVRVPDPDFTYDIRGSRAGQGRQTLRVPSLDRQGQSEALQESLRPIGFAAAYKTLDMLVEHVLRANGAPANRLRRFDQKSGLLTSRPTSPPIPLDTHPALWDRLAKLYREFQEARHAITHRRATPSGGDLRIYDDQRRPIDTVTSDEIGAFAAAVHALAELVIEGSADSRRVQIVAWHLNALNTRHSLPSLAAIDPRANRRRLQIDLVPADSQLRFDVARAREAIESQVGPSLWDLELYAGERLFAGRWEDVPDKGAITFVFDPAFPPPWLTEHLP